MEKFLDKYYDNYFSLLNNKNLYELMITSKELIEKMNLEGNNLFIQGNGASASIASHCALDFTKQAKIKTLSFNESSLITAYANDYGYDKWVSRALESYGKENDCVILISSSGKSENLINAAKYAKNNNMNVITFTGFEEDNVLKSIGDINFWVNSRAYNIIECIHMIWLTTIIDLIIGKSEYSVHN